MFENSEKLLFFLVIALLFLGPEKMAGLGATLGRAIRDFRSTVRGAQETFHEEFSSAARELESPALDPAALPAPDPAPAAPASSDAAPAAAPESSAGTPTTGSSAARAENLDDQSSLASEPTAQALAEHRAQENRTRGR